MIGVIVYYKQYEGLITRVRLLKYRIVFPWDDLEPVWIRKWEVSPVIGGGYI